MNAPEMARGNPELIAYAVHALGDWAGQSQAARGLVPDPTGRLDLGRYRQLLAGGTAKQEGAEAFISLLSQVAPAGEKHEGVTLAACPLALDIEVLSGRVRPDPGLWDRFAAEFERLPREDEAAFFEAFTHLFRKYAWAVPSTYGETGVSLYEEFKALAALVHASRIAPQPAEEFLLIGGDTAGIQEFLYTISSKAAAKGLRGRSVFLQLLSDATVRAILRELDLPWTSVVYVAGGNFLALAPGGAAVEQQLEQFARIFNETLLTIGRGDLNLALGWAPIPTTAVAEPERWREGIARVKERQAQAKRQRFSEIAREKWELVFAPVDEGGERFCAVCHHGLDENEGKLLEWEEGEEALICELCDSFRELAEEIRHDQLWMVVELMDAEVAQGRGWSDALTRLTNLRYRFTNQKPAAPQGSVIYAINTLNFLDSGVGAHGFRLMANVTPKMTDEDVIHARQEAMRGRLAYSGEPRVGAVRDFDMLARDAEGAKWIGVLRMDVDNLGAVFTRWGPERALAGTSALSQAMELFFGGWLNKAVRQECVNSAFVIYAGGDDLFIVGAWDQMIKLAERIRNDFNQYTGCNPHLTISAGISLMERAKYPLYLAAEEARQALDEEAKMPRWDLTYKNNHITQPQAKKNAISFLGTTVGWERWPRVRELQEELVRLCRDENLRRDEKAPRALIQTVRAIHAQYDRGRRDYEAEQRRRGKRSEEIRAYPLFHGRWMYLAAYQLARMGRQHRGVHERLQQLRQEILEPELAPYTGLAARWAEYRLRAQGER